MGWTCSTVNHYKNCEVLVGRYVCVCACSRVRVRTYMCVCVCIYIYTHIYMKGRDRISKYMSEDNIKIDLKVIG